MLMEGKQELSVNPDGIEVLSATANEFINQTALLELSKRTFLLSTLIRRPYIVTIELKSNYLRGGGALSCPLVLSQENNLIFGGWFLIDPFNEFSAKLLERFSQQNNFDPELLTASYLFYHEWKHQDYCIRTGRPYPLGHERTEQSCNSFAESEIERVISGTSQLVIQ